MNQTTNPESTRHLGDFEIVCGDMCVAYEARQVALNRKVARKILSASLGLTSKAVQRFRVIRVIRLMPGI
jgi:hypothetical protein